MKGYVETRVVGDETVLAIQTEKGEFLRADGSPIWSFSAARTFSGPNAEQELIAFAQQHGYDLVKADEM